jgi:hypothetical protein
MWCSDAGSREAYAPDAPLLARSRLCGASGLVDVARPLPCQTPPVADGAGARGTLVRESSLGQLCPRGRAHLQPLEAHPPQPALGLRELDVRVLDDLEPVAPRSATCSPRPRCGSITASASTARTRLRSSDTSPKWAALVGSQASALGDGQELAAESTNAMPGTRSRSSTRTAALTDRARHRGRRPRARRG